jgi:FMN phosphatase YigB (HAD superfamily)
MIKNIIFDLGGVILDLHPEADVLKSFSRFGLKLEAYVAAKPSFQVLFEDFNSGRIAASDFRQAVKKLMNFSLSDADFDSCWQSRLGSIPPQRLEQLTALKAQGYRLFLLSNTDLIHLQALGFEPTSVKEPALFKEIFEKEYYSPFLGRCKPDLAVFQRVLEDSQLRADETLFIDDLQENIQAAQRLGMQVLHWQGLAWEALPSLLSKYT